MKLVNKIIISLLALILVFCGDPLVEIEEAKYEPKIAVEGFLYPGEPVADIKLMRNFPLNSSINLSEVGLTPIRNNVSASINGTALHMNPQTGMYYSNEITPEAGQTYELVVSAIIDGIRITTKSTTIVPEAGFSVLNLNLGDIKYRQERAEIDFNPSPTTGFYAFSIRAEGATVDNFIYDNPYIPNLERKDIEEDFSDFLFQWNMMLNVEPDVNSVINYKVSELDTWFYSNYKVIVYAGDNNFKDYIMTVKNVQEPDGNFVEPVFHFEGEGIGIFGSAIKQEVIFNLIP